MSDITGPPSTQPIQAVSHGTDKATGVSRDKQQTSGQQTTDKREDNARSEQKDQSQFRDPAVSISASAAHIRIGEELKQKVREVDVEGRPIIVTETATYALRPDAGLKVGDDVVLHVKEADKQVSADLLYKNGRVIDPPIRLSLIVISIHSPTEQDRAAIENRKPGLENVSLPYRPQQSSVKQVPETETLANILGRSYSPPPSGPDLLLKRDNPDPTARANSADLGALISAQQVVERQVAAPSPASNLASEKPDRLIPETDLTRLGAAAVSAAQAVGLGPAFTAAQPNGVQVHLQVINPELSRVPPAELAAVKTVTTLTATEARTFEINPQQFAGDGSLAKIETTQGDFITSEKNIAGLVGEQVLVVPIENNQAPENTRNTPEATVDVTPFKARLYGISGGTVRSVDIVFSAPAPETITPDTLTTNVQAVHVIRSFLTAKGPMNDLRIDTSLGSISLTVPNSERPVVGDPITLLPTERATQEPHTFGTQPQAAQTAAAQMVGTSTNILPTATWPAMAEAYSLIAPDNPLAASTIAARTADGGGKIINSMMFLFSALKGGGKNSWLDEKFESRLAEKSASLLERIKSDLSRFLSPAETSGEWRSMLLPFDLKNGEISMLAFLFGNQAHIDPDKNSKHNQNLEKDEKQERFVIEVDFTILGPVQLNGMIKGKRFDLTLHSRQTFSDSLKSDSRGMFEATLAANGFTGQISFFKSDQFPVDTKAVLAAQNS